MKTRLTARKVAILRMLEEHDESTYEEIGIPPYTATDIAQYIDWFGGENGRPEIKWVEQPDGTRTSSDPNRMWRAPASVVQSFARTLRGMVAEGLLVSVREKQDTLNGISGRTMEMPRVCYWSVRTFERDMRRAQAWRAGREAKYGWEPKTFEKFMGKVEDIGLPAIR
ncbi:hypothetical protein AB4Y45_27830 [Paraburkholderia sp. EG287A]|uniref:hypothetical protein n=1 Tax=Paraburkholderia sp. EG287A TaxID=3237012 RepID=UPI0034D3390F